MADIPAHHIATELAIWLNSTMAFVLPECCLVVPSGFHNPRIDVHETEGHS